LRRASKLWCGRSSTRRTTSKVSSVGVGCAVVLKTDDAELLVELYVDLVAVGQRNLDLVLALLVIDLGSGDPALAGVGERGVRRLLQRFPRDRCVRAVVFGAIVTRRCAGQVSPTAATAPIAKVVADASVVVRFMIPPGGSSTDPIMRVTTCTQPEPLT